MKTTFYVQFKAHRLGAKVQRITAERITKQSPGYPMPGGVVVKMTVDLPEDAFYPLEPAVDIVIPIDRTLPIEINVEEPDRPEQEAHS